MRKKIAIITAVVVGLLMASCAGGEAPKKASDASASGAAEPAPGVKQEMTFVLSSEPDGLDPNITNNSFATPYLVNLFEGLTTYNDKNELVPGLAEKWEASEDGKTYTFHLRKGLKWSDGSPLTSAAFKYSMLRTLNPKTGSKGADALTDYIAGANEYYTGKGKPEDVKVSTPDDDTLVVELKAPAGHFPSMVAAWIYAPVNEKTIKANGDKWTRSAKTFISDGPFMVGEIKQGESMTLVKNPNYWDADSVTMESVTFRMIKDQSTALNAYLKGDVDGMAEIPLADMAKLKAEDQGFYEGPQYATRYYLINNSKKPYDDVRVRKAINLAIDRKALVENVLHGNNPLAYSVFPPGYKLDGEDFAEGRGEFDMAPTAKVEEARKLLAEAGYPGGKGFPKVEIYYYSNPQVKLVAEAIGQMLQKNLGLKVTTPNKEWKVYYADVQAGKYDIGAMGFGADFMHPMTFFPTFVSTGMNMAQLSDKKYDDLVAKAQAEADPQKQMELMRAADKQLSDTYAAIPLYYKTATMLMNKKVQGWYLSPMARLYLKNAKVVS